MSEEDFNLYAHFYPQFVRHADDELLCTGDGRAYRYRDIDTTSASIASYLSGLGIAPGDRISVQVEKSPESLCLYLACLRAGLVFHPLNMAYTAGELEYFLNNAEPAVVICDPSNEAPIKGIADAAGARYVFTLDGDGDGSLMRHANETKPDFGIVRRAADDMAARL
mgnify:FL=1